MTSRIPYLPIVVSVSTFVLFGFAAVSAYVIGWTDDEVTKGNIIGTWQNFALLVIGFWIGSSSGGKSKDEPTGTHENPTITEASTPASGTKENPTIVEGAGEHAEPVTTTLGRKP